MKTYYVINVRSEEVYGPYTFRLATLKRLEIELSGEPVIITKMVIDTFGKEVK